MSALRQRGISYTLEEYLAFENFAEAKHEFANGDIYAMAGATPRHNDIAGNAFTSLKTQLRGRPCVARISDQRLFVEAADLITYPDVVVSYAPGLYSDKDSIALIDATVIIEVLSPSTARYDKGSKFDSYKLLPSLRHYLLIEQNRVEVEHCFLGEEGEWMTQIFRNLDDEIEVAAIGCHLRVSEIYEDIEF
jgi:Uma2 family endonuclease